MNAARLRARIGPALPYLALAALAIGMINFLWLLSETLPLNLIPSDGHVTGGHYFLWSKTNGGYVEVSSSFWEWVRFHDASFFMTWPMVMLAGGYLVVAQLQTKMGGNMSPILASERVRHVRTSGALLASTRSAGLIGNVWLSRGLVRIQVYPAGIVLKPVFSAERAILATEIGAVTPKGGLSARSVRSKFPALGFGASEVPSTYHPRGPLVEIEHTGVGMASPLELVGSGNWDIAQAIGRVADAARGTSAANVLTPPQEAPMPSSVSDSNATAKGGAAQRGRWQHLPAPIELGLAILGAVIGVAMLWFGIAWFIPQLGLFGVVWTVWIVVILALNARRFLLRRHR
jgi:hypothetical protein